MKKKDFLHFATVNVHIKILITTDLSVLRGNKISSINTQDIFYKNYRYVDQWCNTIMIPCQFSNFSV